MKNEIQIELFPTRSDQYTPKIGVHVRHCCSIHGCKYGNLDCPVEIRTVEQDHPCEQCSWKD